jgi:hypothetical protein
MLLTLLVTTVAVLLLAVVLVALRYRLERIAEEVAARRQALAPAERRGYVAQLPLETQR